VRFLETPATVWGAESVLANRFALVVTAADWGGQTNAQQQATVEPSGEGIVTISSPNRPS
jgi:hypothetical protein